MRLPRNERGISSVIAAVSLIAVFGAAVLAIDAGGLWATRRRLVTGTDAGVLAAARLFSTGLASSCTDVGKVAGESEATTVLHTNEPDAKHNATDTPNGYEVTTQASDCTVGHVRFDGRLTAEQSFSGIFGFTKIKPFSSSTAQFGYIVALSVGLRPFTVCDQHDPWAPASPAPNPLPPATGAGPFAHYALWNWLQKGQITQGQYDSYFATNPDEYPSGAIMGKNAGLSYLSPTNGGGVVHKINLKDNCGGGAAWRGWVDYNSGSNGTSTLESWLTGGYPGEVALTPHDCTDENTDTGEDCDAFPGNHNGLQNSLDDITCPAATPSRDCFVFPVILNAGVVDNGASGIQIDQSGFLFVIMRGYASDNQNNPCNGNASCLLDLEFVSIQATGKIGLNPSGGATTPRGTSLCGVDHDSLVNRCDV